MENLIPCRFHTEVSSVLKAEGLRATKQRLAIWDELSSTDNHRNIEASSALGIQSILFKNPDDLERDLKEKGIRL